MKWVMHLSIGILEIISTTANDEFQHLGQKLVEETIPTELDLGLNESNYSNYFSNSNGSIKLQKTNSLSFGSGSSVNKGYVKPTEAHPVNFYEGNFGNSGNDPTEIYTSTFSNILEYHVCNNLHLTQDLTFNNKAKNKRKIETIGGKMRDDESKTEKFSQFFEPLVKFPSQLTNEEEENLSTKDLISRFGEENTSSPVENSMEYPVVSELTQPKFKKKKPMGNMSNHDPITDVSAESTQTAQRISSVEINANQGSKKETIGSLGVPSSSRSFDKGLNISSRRKSFLSTLTKSQNSGRSESSKNSKNNLLNSEQTDKFLKKSSKKGQNSKNIKCIGSEKQQIKYKNLLFHGDILKGENLSQSEITHIKNISGIMESLPKIKKGAFGLSKRGAQNTCSIIRKTNKGLQGTDLPAKMKLFSQDKDVWFEHWNQEENVDWKDSMDDLVFFGLPYIFPVFLFYVEMIMTIIPHNKFLKSDEEINHPREIEKAIDFFKEFKTFIESETVLDQGVNLWERRKTLILSYVKYSNHHSKVSTLWHFIEAYMERENPSLLEILKDRSKTGCNKQIKNFFNSIFYYGSEILTQQLREMMKSE